MRICGHVHEIVQNNEDLEHGFVWIEKCLRTKNKKFTYRFVFRVNTEMQKGYIKSLQH